MNLLDAASGKGKNGTLQTIQDIEHGILAATPLMYVVTAEEGRFQSEVERICMTRSRKLWVHAISTGIYNVHFAWMDGSWKNPVIPAFRGS
jgi:hypothetical protein